MGTTLTALNAGSLSYRYVVAIEGYSQLLTSAAPSAAVTAWSGTGWGEHHRQGLAANGVTLAPIVSAQPRAWVGKWVGVWLHREVGGVLDVKAQAQLVYFGRIVEIRDDPTTGATVVQLKHAMDS